MILIKSKLNKLELQQQNFAASVQTDKCNKAKKNLSSSFIGGEW